MRLEFYGNIFFEISPKYQISWKSVPVGAELFRADGRTDMTKPIVAFPQLSPESFHKKWKIHAYEFFSFIDFLFLSEYSKYFCHKFNFLGGFCNSGGPPLPQFATSQLNLRTVITAVHTVARQLSVPTNHRIPPSAPKPSLSQPSPYAMATRVPSLGLRRTQLEHDTGT